ncbi:ion transport peptide-like isoform X1 [Diaphorina citri]|uniref:Ion transport peptide-like isoform X1 n=2 Tax=Diaphorina citri TaxID=121845 RepID=A0A3Q0J3X2_DIACI|nr:ion transport peptide-like isoform X1 [Diaphorina citri]XP_026683193.1 ion transport peptide-like isoform X1 [Diaphorina citri]
MMLQCRLTLLVLIIMTVTMLVLDQIQCSPVNTRNNNQIAGHPLSKRSFFDIQCKGVYDKSIFARLDRICEDCYDLFRAPQIHTLCRKDCFTSDYFKGCLEVLRLTDESDSIQADIMQLHGVDPGL